MERTINKVEFLKGYEGLYLIDNLGNIISCPRHQGRYLHNKYVILSNKLGKEGYFEVTLSKGGKMKTYLLHRLIAKQFLNNKNNYKQVNHVNGIKTDNRIENLEWVNESQNTKHAFENNLSEFQKHVMGNLAKINEKTMYSKVIISNGNFVKEFNSTKECADYLKTNKDNISRAIRKKQKCKGYLVIGTKPNANGEI